MLHHGGAGSPQGQNRDYTKKKGSMSVPFLADCRANNDFLSCSDVSKQRSGFTRPPLCTTADTPAAHLNNRRPSLSNVVSSYLSMVCTCFALFVCKIKSFSLHSPCPSLYVTETKAEHWTGRSPNYQEKASVLEILNTSTQQTTYKLCGF
jgi:hypothetical protein